MIIEKIKSKAVGYTARCKCDNCGKLFYKPYCWVTRRSIKRQFCDKKCYNEWNIGENAQNFGKKHTDGTKEKLRQQRIGNKNPAWGGGIIKHEGGYLRILDNGKYPMAHRYLYEKETGKKLEEGQVIHHVNGIKDDNRLENLMIFKNQSEHKKYHDKLGELIGTK